jgi:exonuclease VII small subunit
MKFEQVMPLLAKVGKVKQVQPDQWQVEANGLRLLVLLNEPRDWVRILLPVAPQADALPLMVQLLEANFDWTGAVRFALQEQALWAVFQHHFSTLTAEDFSDAIAQLKDCKEELYYLCFEGLLQTRMEQIVQVLKNQNKTLDDAIQALNRFYEEGVMGSLEASGEQRALVLEQWRKKLARLWEDMPA